MGYFGQGALGAEPTTGSGDLSVRYYPTVSGWASYQSPESDRILRALQRELRRGGMLTVDEDGIVQGADLSATRLFATQHKGDTRNLIGASFGQFGGRVDTAARALEAVAGSAQMLAERGSVAYGYLKAINDAMGKVPVLPPTVRPSPVTTPSPAVPPGAVPGAPPSELVATLKSPIGIAAIGVGVLLYTMTRSGGRRRRR